MIFAVLDVSRSTGQYIYLFYRSVHLFVLEPLCVKMQEPIYRLPNNGCKLIYTL